MKKQQEFSLRCKACDRPLFGNDNLCPRCKQKSYKQYNGIELYDNDFIVEEELPEVKINGTPGSSSSTS